jgi:hypothetical protein
LEFMSAGSCGLPGVERGVVGPMDLVRGFKCIDKSPDLNTND